MFPVPLPIRGTSRQPGCTAQRGSVATYAFCAAVSAREHGVTTSRLHRVGDEVHCGDCVSALAMAAV